MCFHLALLNVEGGLPVVLTLAVEHVVTFIQQVSAEGLLCTGIILGWVS